MKLLKNAFTVLAIIVAILLVSSSNIFAKTVTVTVDTLKLREDASTESDVLDLLNRGQKLQYLDEVNNWYKVKVDGTIGYVSKDFTKLQDDSEENNVTQNTETNTTNTKQTNTVVNNEVENNAIENNENEVVNGTENNKNDIVSNENEVTRSEILNNEDATEMKVSINTNIYILPLINANVIQNIQKDSNVRIISKTNGWAYVETDEVMGWIRQNALTDSSVVFDDIDIEDDEDKNEEEPEIEKPEEPKDSDDKITSKVMYINSPSVYVRKGPSTDTEVIDSLVLNDTVKIIAENGDWYKVELEDTTGYIAKRLLSSGKTETTSRGEEQRNAQPTTSVETTSANSTKGEKIVEYAKQYLNRPYVYGASGPDSFDCSGFTMYIFKQFGITLSHSATAQSKVGTYVAKENLQPGDLVFFTDYETGDGIGHCGIYIGNGDFIHASSGVGYCVKISTLLTGSYYNRYESARRII